MKNIKKVELTLRMTDHGNELNYHELKYNINRYVFERQHGKKERRKNKGYFENTNFIYEYLQAKTQNSFIKSNSYEVVFANYSEKPGSLLVSFTLIVIGTIANYNLFTEGLEKFVIDINNFFNSDENFGTQTDYTIHLEKETMLDIAAPYLKPQLPLFKNAKNGITLIFAFALSVAGIFDDQIFSDNTVEKALPTNLNTLTEEFIEHQIQEEREKNIHKHYDFVIEQASINAELEKDTLSQEVINKLKRQLNIYKE